MFTAKGLKFTSFMKYINFCSEKNVKSTILFTVMEFKLTSFSFDEKFSLSKYFNSYKVVYSKRLELKVSIRNNNNPPPKKKKKKKSSMIVKFTNLYTVKMDYKLY